MQFDDVVLGRRSIRGYKPVPVPKELIKEVIEMAMRAPSSLNTQPWNFYVISGEPLDRIRTGNTERILAGMPDSREFRGHGGYEGVHRERQIDIAKQLFAAMGIEREDKEGRQDWVLRGFRQFDAPVSVVVTYDRTIHGGDIGPFDWCGDQCPRQCGLVPRSGMCRQQPGHYAVSRRSRTRSHSRRSSHHDLRCHGVPGRFVPCKCSGFPAQVGR